MKLELWSSPLMRELALQTQEVLDQRRSIRGAAFDVRFEAIDIFEENVDNISGNICGKLFIRKYYLKDHFSGTHELIEIYIVKTKFPWQPTINNRNHENHMTSANMFDQMKDWNIFIKRSEQQQSLRHSQQYN